MKAYVVDEKGKVVEQRGTITKAQLKDKNRLIMAFDKSKPNETTGNAEWAVGEEVKASHVLNSSQLRGVLSAVKAHVTNCFLAASV